MEYAVPVSIIIGSLGMIITLIATSTRNLVRIEHIEDMVKLNDERHANPEASGIGTKTTNTLIDQLSNVIADGNKRFEKMMDKNNEFLLRATMANEGLTKAIEKLS